MRTVILVGLILHLVITVVTIDDNYEFGDIISFPRTFAKIKKSYKHFAIYLGPQTNLPGQGNMDLFHRIRKPINGQYCVFGSLKNEPKRQKENYLDGKLTRATNEGILRHIKAMMEHCGDYKLFTNNCEHLATYVRYGRAYSKQPGTLARLVCIFGERSCPAADAAVQRMEAEDREFHEILNRLHENQQTEAEAEAEADAAG